MKLEPLDSPTSGRNTRRKATPRSGGPPSEAPVSVETPAIAATPPESRMARTARGAIGFAMVLGLGLGVAWAARYYVKTSPRFAIREIITTGANHRTPEQLAAAAGVRKGQNVFTADLDGARARLLADPWISEATLARQLPGTVFLRVVEREAAGIVATNDGSVKAAGGETYLVTRDGAIIKRLESGDPNDLTVVTGVVLQQLVDDREGAARTIRRALDLASDYEHGPLAQRAPLEEVHVEGSGELTLVIGKSAIALRMGEPPYRRKLEQAVRVVSELDRRGAKADVIMLDNEARPDRVVVRMR